MERKVANFKLIDRAMGYCPAHKLGGLSPGKHAKAPGPKESDENRDLCLNCTKPDCRRCKGPNRNGPGPVSKYDPEKLEALVKEGLSRKEIAQQLGVSESTVHSWMHKLKGGTK